MNAAAIAEIPPAPRTAALATGPCHRTSDLAALQHGTHTVVDSM